MIAVSIFGAGIHQFRLNRTISNSPFSRLKARLLGLFDEPRTLEAAIKQAPSGAVNQISPPSGIQWRKVATVFWLGNDLEWTRRTALAGQPKERISHGLVQCNHHVAILGLADSPPGRQLSAVKSQLASMPETALSPDWRNDFATRVDRVAHGISAIAKIEQPDFRPNP